MSIERRLEKLERQLKPSGPVEEMTDEQLEAEVRFYLGSLFQQGETVAEVREWFLREYPDLSDVFEHSVRQYAEH